MPKPIETTYDVRIWTTEKYVGTKVTTHRVIWVVAGKRWKQGHRTAAAAENFRSELVTAVRKGEAFDVATGRPVAMARRETNDTTWYDFACQYVDMKWGPAAAAYRKSIAEALTTVTLVLIATDRGKPADDVLRMAVGTWGFNTRLRHSPRRPAEVAVALTWLAENTQPVANLAEAAVIRTTLDALTLNLDGSRAAGTTVARKRAVLSNALSYAVELNLLAVNPVGSIAWRSPKTSRVVDRRSVVSLMQARMLLNTVEQTKRSGPRLVAFFAVMYYAGLRPEEAVNLRIGNLQLPTSGGRGWIVLDRSAPDVGRIWTDSGEQRDHRQLKHRADGEVRTVPSSPVLTFLLQRHLEKFGTDAEGPAVRRRTRRPARCPRLHEGVGPGPQGAVHPRLLRLTAGPQAVRPSARRGVDLAEQRCSPDPGRRVGWTQRRRPPGDLRQVHRRATRSSPAAARRGHRRVVTNRHNRAERSTQPRAPTSTHTPRCELHGCGSLKVTSCSDESMSIVCAH